MYLLVVTYAGHNFYENALYADSRVVGTFKTIEQCKEASKIDLNTIFSDLALDCVDPDSDCTISDFIQERWDAVVFSDLDDTSFARPYAERYLAEYDFNEGYGLDAIKYLIIKI